MEEMVDVLDQVSGEKTGEVITKKEAHKTGKWHGSIHVLIVNSNCTKTLLQKRCRDKKLYPNMWDIAVGGHISAGEDALMSAKRELTEELGIKFVELKKVDRITEKLVNNGIISNEFVTIYVAYADIDIGDVRIQEEEVSEVKWCTKDEMNKLIENDEMIPHVREYEILNQLLK